MIFQIYRYSIHHDNDKYEFEAPLFVTNGMDLILHDLNIPFRVMAIDHTRKVVFCYTTSNNDDEQDNPFE